MNKLIILFTFLLITSNIVKAQVCTPDENITSVVVPSTSEELTQAQVGVAYEQTFYFRIPEDTVLTVSGFEMDTEINYLQITSIDNLPEGFTYECSTVDCKFDGNTFGCMSVTGTPDETYSGDSVRLTLNLNINGTGILPFIGPFNGDIPVVRNFAIYVEPADTSNNTDTTANNTDSVNFVNKIQQQELFTIFPNPSNNLVNIEIETEEVGALQIIITNLTGQVVYHETILNYNGIYNQQVTKSNLGTGIFFVQVTINGKQETTKLVIN